MYGSMRDHGRFPSCIIMFPRRWQHTSSRSSSKQDTIEAAGTHLHQWHDGGQATLAHPVADPASEGQGLMSSERDTPAQHRTRVPWLSLGDTQADHDVIDGSAAARHPRFMVGPARTQEL